MEKKNDFKPFISADKVLPEFTVTSVILGMILAVIFGGANAYLGLRVGMTVSASIPAAVISMGVSFNSSAAVAQTFSGVCLFYVFTLFLPGCIAARAAPL